MTTQAFLTMHQAAVLAIIPKAGGMTDQALATATTFELRMLRDQLQGLVAGGYLVRDPATGEYRHAEKAHA